MAQACPLVAAGGGVEVGELTLLSAASLQTTPADHATATQACVLEHLEALRQFVSTSLTSRTNATP